MPTGRSFAEYVKNKCFDDLYDAADEYIQKEWQKLDLRARRVKNIGQVELVEISIKRVYVNDLPGMMVAFDIGLELDLALHDEDLRNEEIDECVAWIRVSCQGNLAYGLDDWEIVGIEPYSVKNAPANSLSDALVPFIPNERLETVANEFLKEYYPEALKIVPHGKAPICVDPVDLAHRLGLSITTQRIREDSSVFGQLYFVDTDAPLFDSASGSEKIVHLNERTIVVDPMNFLLRNFGSVNNTIIHECVHWVKHRKVFELEKLYNEDASCISCVVVGGAISDMAKSATVQMERQATQLAPRIQMPAEPFKAKAKEYIAKFMREKDARHENEVMEDVIRALETDFVVSKQAAKIRLVELGFESAIGTFTYIDNHYVKPHSFRPGSIKLNQTFSISAQDAAIERFVNQEFKSLTENGDYLFIDNHFVYNAPLYVERDENGRLDLTSYARSHMDECCLVFDMNIQTQVGSDYHTLCFLNREPSNYTFDLHYHNGYENAPQERQVAMRKKKQAEYIEIRKQMTDDQAQCMELLLNWRKKKYTEFCFADADIFEEFCSLMEYSKFNNSFSAVLIDTETRVAPESAAVIAAPEATSPSTAAP